jgi:hypothetical protein
VVDSNLNSLASDRQIDVDTDLSDPNTIQIVVPVPPTGNVSITVDAAGAISKASSTQAPTIYVFSTAGDSGDADDTFEALAATIDSTTNTISVTIPGGAFQPNSGMYLADLKIGVATAYTSPGPTPAIRKNIQFPRGNLTADPHDRAHN